MRRSLPVERWQGEEDKAAKALKKAGAVETKVGANVAEIGRKESSLATAVKEEQRASDRQDERRRQQEKSRERDKDRADQLRRQQEKRLFTDLETGAPSRSHILRPQQ